MSTAPRAHRFFWFAGILLLIGTAVGAGFVFNNGVGNHPTPAPTVPEPDKTPPPLGVVAVGFVDIEPGVTNLYPVQQGRIMEVVEEGHVATKNQILLRLDNRLAKSRVQEAKADLSAAQQLLRQAEKLPEQHEQKIQQQKAALDAARFQKVIAEQEYKSKEKAYNDKVVSLEMKVVAEELVKTREAMIQAEQGKLNELGLFDPRVDAERARADVAAKQARLDQAELALQECDLLAPFDGTVLRVLAHQGEVLSASAKAPAIQFAPHGAKIIRAEVLQEWASKVQLGQEVTIVDDTFASQASTGKVKRISPWFTNKRSVIFEPFMYNDVRTMECLIEVTSEEKQPLRIGQRVRVTIKPNEPK